MNRDDSKFINIYFAMPVAEIKLIDYKLIKRYKEAEVVEDYDAMLANDE